MAVIECPTCGYPCDENAQNVGSCPECGMPLRKKSNDSHTNQASTSRKISSDTPTGLTPLDGDMVDLLKNETVLFRAKWSFVYVWLWAIIGVILTIITGVTMNNYYYGYGDSSLSWLIILILTIVVGIISYYSIKKSVLLITNHRIVLKKGLIIRKVLELPIDRWESVWVVETLFGRICGYGIVAFRGVGSSMGIAAPIKDAFAVRKHFVEIKYRNK